MKVKIHLIIPKLNLKKQIQNKMNQKMKDKTNQMIPNKILKKFLDSNNLMTKKKLLKIQTMKI